MWDEIMDMPGEIFDIEDFKVDVKMPCEIALESDKEIMAIHNQLDQWHKGGCIAPHLLYCIEVNQTTPNMRKIESQMCAAIQANKNWSSGNTQVVTNDGVSTVYLHGNKIAMVDDTTMTIFDGGWQSNTTKSRLNALCDEFCIAGEGVFQKDFLWYVRKFVGCVNGQNVYKTEDFESGYVFA